MLGFGLVEGSASIEIWDVDELLMSAEYAPLRKKGETSLIESMPQRKRPP